MLKRMWYTNYWPNCHSRQLLQRQDEMGKNKVEAISLHTCWRRINILVLLHSSCTNSNNFWQIVLCCFRFRHPQSLPRCPQSVQCTESSTASTSVPRQQSVSTYLMVCLTPTPKRAFTYPLPAEPVDLYTLVVEWWKIKSMHLNTMGINVHE